jgi:two-component system response regulator YesN
MRQFEKALNGKSGIRIGGIRGAIKVYSVLLADDETIFLEFMQNIINWSEYNCEVSASLKDGKAVCEYILKDQPDIAFIDISMPLMDGIQVCEKVRENCSATRLVIATAHDEFNFAYQAIKLGIDDYLLKPFSKEELMKTLNKVINTINTKRQGFNEKETLDQTIEHLVEGSAKYKIMSHAIEEYLNANYSRKSLTLAAIASDLGFESSYLRRVYKVTSGSTITQKLEDIRIGQAKHLLLLGEYQNQEIAEMVGYSDQFYFSKRFKQACGVSPTEYQRGKHCHGIPSSFGK